MNVFSPTLISDSVVILLCSTHSTFKRSPWPRAKLTGQRDGCAGLKRAGRSRGASAGALAGRSHSSRILLMSLCVDTEAVAIERRTKADGKWQIAAQFRPNIVP